MESSKWGTKRVEGIGKLERCLLGKKEIQIPEILVENSQIFSQVMSQSTWNETLTESQRQHLMKFLPKFPENDMTEKKESIRRLFAGDNFKFGNPLKKFQAHLKDGSYTPDIAKYSHMCRKVKQREYRYRQQKYYSELLKEILVSRQRVLEQLTRLPPDEPLKFDYVPPKPKENPVSQRVKRKYKRLLEEVRQECGIEEVSSEEEEPSPVQRSKKQLYKSLCPIPSPEPTIPSVQATFAIKPSALTNGEDGDTEASQLKRPRPISPVEITEDDYRKMLLKHHKRAFMAEDEDDEDHPEYDTQNITLQDVMARCQASRKGGQSLDDDFESPPPPGPVLKKKLKKEKSEKKGKKKVTAKKISEMEIDVSNLDDDDEFDMKTNSSVTRDDDDISLQEFSNIEPMKVKEEFQKYTSFFSLLRDFICSNPDKRISSMKLEEKVRVWQDSPACDLSPWIIQLDNWVDAVFSALKFLAGEAIGMNIENFIPYLDYKERAQQWRWIGTERDSDETLATLCQNWLKHKNEVDELVVDINQGTPPPARSRTTFIVRQTTEEEKNDFREQEKVRFDNPHRAFTYVLHGYESVVGPVKGIFNKESSVTKAREHALLVSSRPAFVTILTLVRDSAARLPNGEGTRGDICELLKDSQFLAPGVTDAQLNVVVSGALDRLHSEKDPCVKYDVNRKIWIYLHRCRTEEEFEKIHQAQAAAAKARKSLHKVKIQKTPKSKEPSSQQPSTTVSNLSMPSSLSASTESINVEDLSPQQPGTQAQLLASPKSLHTSPLSVTTSPRHTTQTGPKIAEGTKTSLRQVISNMVSAQASKASASPSGNTQTLSAAQLQLLQQAAQAQAAQAQAAKAEAAKVLAHATAQGTAGKTVAQVLGETASRAEIISLEKARGQGQLKPTTPQSAPPNIVITKPELLLHRQVPGSPSQGQGSPSPQVVTTVSMVTKTVTVATSSGANMVTVASTNQPSANPLMARLVQQMGAGQMLSVSDLLAAQRLQGQQQRTTSALKIQGTNVIHQVAGGSQPVAITGKPLTQTKGQLLQLGGKGKPQLGLIQTPKGTINIIPQTGSSGGIVTIPQAKTAGGSTDTSRTNAPLPTAAGQSKLVSHAAGSQTVQVINQSKPATQNPVVVTHMTAGGLALRPGGASPILVTTTSAGSAPNLQMVRTVLSQPAGLKPGQAILISQPALQSAGTVIPQAQVIQGARPQGKQQQMYARIITPPSGVKFSTVGTGIAMPTQGGMIHAVGPAGQTITVQSEAMLQTVSKILSASGTGTPTTVTMTTGASPTTSIATGQQILTVSAAGKGTETPSTNEDKK